MNPQISIIIVNYKTHLLVKKCITSIKENTTRTPFEIIVVDNSNEEEEFQFLKKIQQTYDDVKVIKSNGNVGFGRANNAGAAIAKGQYLLFLNSDTLLLNDAVSILFQTFQENTNIGAAGPNMYSINGKPHHSFLRKETTAMELLKRRCIFSSIKRHFLNSDQFNYSNQIIDISGYICGACMLIPKELFEELGGFDSEIFMYSEDNLLCYLIRKKGFRVVNNPNAKIIHLEGQSDAAIFSEEKIKNMVYGDYIRQIRAYGARSAKRYLKIAAIVYGFVSIRKKIFHCAFWENDRRLSREYSRLLKSVAKKRRE